MEVAFPCQVCFDERFPGTGAAPKRNLEMVAWEGVHETGTGGTDCVGVGALCDGVRVVEVIVGGKVEGVCDYDSLRDVGNVTVSSLCHGDHGDPDNLRLGSRGSHGDDHHPCIGGKQLTYYLRVT